MAEPTWDGGHALIIEFGDAEFHARCQCGHPLGYQRPDQSLDRYQHPWERHIMATPDATVTPEPRQPCPEGFHWVGQTFASCAECGLPAWEHDGEARLPKDAGLFAIGDPEWELRPWKPGEADAIRAKWGTHA